MSKPPNFENKRLRITNNRSMKDLNMRSPTNQNFITMLNYQLTYKQWTSNSCICDRWACWHKQKWSHTVSRINADSLINIKNAFKGSMIETAFLASQMLLRVVWLFNLKLLALFKHTKLKFTSSCNIISNKTVTSLRPRDEHQYHQIIKQYEALNKNMVLKTWVFQLM